VSTLRPLAKVKAFQLCGKKADISGRQKGALHGRHLRVPWMSF